MINPNSNMQKYIDRNSGIDALEREKAALEREIQQLKTALEVSESENKALRDIAGKLSDYLLAQSNADFAKFCGKDVAQLKAELLSALSRYEELEIK